MRKTWLAPLITLLLGTGLVAQQGTTKPAEKAKAEMPAATTAPKAEASAPAAMSGAAATASNDDYKIGAEDLLDINVWREPEMSRTVPVRPDGKISLPLLGEFEAAGATAKQLEAKISKQLETIVTNPQVTVIVREMRSQKYSITGEVNRPGTYPLSTSTTILDAIATAGGMKDFAKPKKMYILRRNGDAAPTKIPVNYKDVVDGRSPAITLQARDTVVVP